MTGVHSCLSTQPETLTKIKQTEEKKNRVDAYKHYLLSVTYSNQACLQVLKTTLDLLLGTFESQRKEDNSTVDLVTHSEGFVFFVFFLAVCTGLLSSREHVHVSTAEELDPA